MARGQAQTSGIPRESSAADFSVPASFAQQRLWFLDRLLPGLSIYNISVAWRVRGKLRIPALQRALDDLVERHEVLRTTFDSASGAPLQLVAARHTQRLDFEAIPAGTGVDDRIAASLLAEAELPFDLATGPLMRARLACIADDDHILMLTIHHAIADEWSLGLMTRELFSLYLSHRDGTPAQLPDLRIQYADFSAWQRATLRGERLDRLLAYWRGRLAGAPHSMDLQPDRARPGTPSHVGGWVGIELDSIQSEALRDLGRRCEITLFMTVAALFQVLLYRGTAQRDFLVGYPATGRDRPELEGVVGLFVNMLVMRARLEPGMSFMDVARQAKEDVLEGHAHRELPFEMLVDALQTDRDAVCHPLFQVAVAVGDLPARDLHVPGLQLQPVSGGRRTSKFDLTLFFSQSGDGLLGGGFEYSTDLFDRETVQAWSMRLITLVDALACGPDRPIAELDLLPAAERLKLIQTWNPAPRAAPAWCVHERVAQHARERPAAPAVWSGGHCLSYGELDAQAERLALQLRARGVGRWQAVGLHVERSAWMVIGMLGALKAGAAYVPFDPQLPEARLRFMAGDMGVACVLTTRPWMSTWEPGTMQPLLMDVDSAPGLSPVPEYRASHADLAYCIYTSGSSGDPKAVAVSHGALSALVSWHHERYAIRTSDRIAQIASPGFDACTWDTWACLAAGATLVVVDDDTRGDPASLLAFLASQQVTHAFLPTPLAEAVLSDPAAMPPGLALRVLLTGGDRLHHAPAPGLPFELVNHYGPTETAVVATAATIDACSGDLPTIGRPIATATVYILDPVGDPVPIGVSGELHIGGAGVGLGYWGRRRLTAECFLPDPFGAVPGGRLFRTGDAARHRADGSIEFLGRLDRQFKLRGYRIEPGEIEVTLGRHPSVRRCAAELREKDDGACSLTVFVESDLSAQEGSTLWRRHLERFLPAFMLPDSFVAVDVLPLLPSGKLDRRALAWPANAAPAACEPCLALRGPLEERLVAIWCELLGVDRVGTGDNFFKLGGHSLLAIKLVAQIRAELGMALQVRDVFDHPTVARLHDCIVRLQWLNQQDGFDADARERGEL